MGTPFRGGGDLYPQYSCRNGADVTAPVCAAVALRQETVPVGSGTMPQPPMSASPRRPRLQRPSSPFSVVFAWLGGCLLLACAASSASGPSTPSIEPTPAAEEPPADGSEPCRRALGGDSPVSRACRQGGIAAAKATMKELVKEGRSAGLKLACDDCHLDTTDFTRLNAEAPERLRNLLATVGRR
jgi:hypothetical protein